MTSKWNGLRLTAATLLMATLAACGGGGGGSSSLNTPAGTPPTAAATSVVTTGPITAFGSVYVNGVRYETGNAQIEIDGRAATQAELKVGHVVELKGTRGPNGANASAARIVRRNAVTGPIATIDATTNRITVLGQTVLLTASTSFDDSISPANLSGLKAGDTVEVSGLPNASAQIEATRIEKVAAGTTWKVVGKATSTSTATKKLSINALVVDWSAATLTDFTGGAPKDGDIVEAKGTSLNAAKEFVATSLANLGARELKPDAGGEQEVEGFVTRFASATDFDVNGKPVTTNGSTTYEGGTASDLKLNARVEAEGTLNSSGVLVAAKIKFRVAANVHIQALVDKVDTTAGTVTVLGIQVTVDSTTRVEDRSAGRSQFFRLSDVKVGDPVEIRGYESPANSNKVVAVRLERWSSLPEPRIRGPVRSATSPQFTVLATPVATTNTTRFDGAAGSLTQTQFFATAGLVGQVVDVRGSWNGTTLTASRVQLGMHDD